MLSSLFNVKAFDLSASKGLIKFPRENFGNRGKKMTEESKEEEKR